MGEASSWTCPFCNQSAIIRDDDRWTIDGQFAHPLTQAEPKSFALSAVFCPNAKCQNYTLELVLSGLTEIVRSVETRGVGSRAGVHTQRKWGIIHSWKLRPDSAAKPFPDYIPAAILGDYREACLIANLSAKASATLARRCLQGMIRDFWSINKRSLRDEIQALKDKVNEPTWDAIDAVRQIGNIGAHMEADINVIAEVEPGEATLLIGLIESLLAEWYVARHDRDERMARLKAAADAKKN